MYGSEQSVSFSNSFANIFLNRVLDSVSLDQNKIEFTIIEDFFIKRKDN